MEKKYQYRKDGDGKRIENEDIADVYNTVLKMAAKRAQVAMTLNVTAATYADSLQLAAGGSGSGGMGVRPAGTGEQLGPAGHV